MGDESQKGESKADLTSRLNELLGQLLRKEEVEPESAFQKFCRGVRGFIDSAFFVTLVGGILLAWLSYRWQRHSAEQSEKETRAQQIAQRKERLAYEFAKDFPLTLHLAQRIRSRQAWMEQPEASERRFLDGRSFAETRDYTDHLVERYFVLRPAGSVCNELAASFPTSTNIVGLAHSLNQNVSALILATNQAAIDEAFNSANTIYQLLTSNIFTQLNKTNEDNKILP